MDPHRLRGIRPGRAHQIHQERRDTIRHRGADFSRSRCVWTVREVAEFGGIGGLGPVVVGSPERVADELQSWVAETDIDGFNLAYAVTPETFSDIVDLLVPELRRRGVYKQDYVPGTLREKLFGRGAHLQAPHPAAGYRHWLRHSASDPRRAAAHEPA